MIRIVLIIIDIAALIGALIWFMYHKTWEPLVTSLSLLGGLIALIFSKKRNRKDSQIQKAGDNSTNLQAGGDINIS